MTQKFFIDADGFFVGSYDGPDDIVPEEMKGLGQVPGVPDDIRQKWSGNDWLPFTPSAPPEEVSSVH